MNSTIHKKRTFLGLFYVDKLRFWYFKYILGGIVVSILVVAIGIHIALSYSAKIVKVLSEQAQKTNVALSLDTIVEIIKNIQIRVRNTLIVEAIVLIILGFFISLYFANKITGAIKRINCEIDEMIEGKTEFKKVYVRRTDYIKPFVDILNKVIEKYIVEKKNE